MPPTPLPLKKIRLGILVPSSNTTLEPLTTSLLLTPLLNPNLTIHFSRFPVTEISLTPTALSQFTSEKILQAAELLAHAGVDVIGWSGTSAGWLGYASDIKLCEEIFERTGIVATTSVIGLVEILKFLEEGRLGLVTPYLDDVQEKILGMFADEGFEVWAESHLNRRVNVEFAEIGEEVLDGQMREVVGKMMGEGESGRKVVSTFCTNLRAAQRVAFWEEEYPGLIVLDTVATVVWDMLRIAKVDMKGIVGWGKLFSIVPSST